MPDVKSPYNFVPAPTESEVYKPDWAHQVSHDIPFSDGQSGEITLKITAETPIFIRNGHAKPKDGEEVTSEFSHVMVNGQKQYLIPATSIKGMLRNVLEIMSFSRMKQVDDEPFFGLRDMHNDSYKKETNQNILKSGWLKKEGNQWFMYPVDHVRVSMEDIENYYRLPNNKIQKAETAIQKYEILKEHSLEVKSTFIKDLIKENQNRPGFEYGKLHKLRREGQFSGTLVLYGYINGKHYDFVFAKENQQKYPVDSVLIANMDRLNHELWNYHKPSNRIPVFFKLEGSKIEHFGFSKLYRLNNGNSIGDLEPFKSYKTQGEGELDLAQLIFGTIDEKTESLKGRVFISHAFCTNNPTTQKKEERVLSDPKPSYYPYYISQSGTPYKTYQDTNAKLAGFKRYPIHINVKPNGHHENENIPSFFKPLPANTTFECKIRFHNLRKAEIGALLSAITFHGTPNLFHSLGGAKSYGFGKVKIDVLDGMHFTSYMSNFEVQIQNSLNINWVESPQILELFASAKPPKDRNVDSLLVYPQLELPNTPSRDANEFVNVKKSKNFLQSHSIINGSISPKSLQQDFYKEKIQSVEILAREAIENYDFKGAKSFYQELIDLKIPSINSLAKIKEIETLEAEYLQALREKDRLEEEQKLFEDALTSGDQNIINQFLIKYPNNPRRKELEVVLANQGFPADLIETNISFNAFKSKIDRWIVNVQDVTPYRDDLDNAIKNFVRQQFKSNRTRRDWNGAFERNNNWKKVTEWLGEDRANALYQELINP